MLTIAKCTSVRQPKKAAAAVVRLTACVADINDWMKASRLRLNPAKTEIMWLGTSQQLDKITVRDVQLLSTDVTDGRRFSTQPRRHHRQPAVAGGTCCRCLSQWLLPTTATSSSDGVSVCRCCQDTSAGLHIQPIGLLQRTAVWRV